MATDSKVMARALRKYREEECMGNTYRRPRLYKDLISERILPPFVRKDRRD